KSGTSASGSPAAGSSIRTKRGSVASARATPSLRSSPCARAPAGEFACSASPSSSSSSAARRRAARTRAPEPRAAVSTFSRTDRFRKEWLCWNVRARPARPLRCGVHEVMSLEPSSTLPELGKSKPVIRFTSVVLPAPSGPMSPTTSCRCRLTETSLSAWMPSKARETAVARSESPGHLCALLDRASVNATVLREGYHLLRLQQLDERLLVVLDLHDPPWPPGHAVQLGREGDRSRDGREVVELLECLGE